MTEQAMIVDLWKHVFQHSYESEDLDPKLPPGMNLS